MHPDDFICRVEYVQWQLRIEWDTIAYLEDNNEQTIISKLLRG